MFNISRRIVDKLTSSYYAFCRPIERKNNQKTRGTIWRKNYQRQRNSSKKQKMAKRRNPKIGRK